MAEYGIDKNLPITLKKMTDDKYSILNDQFLIGIKDRLRTYVMGDGKPYSFRHYKELRDAYGGNEIPEHRQAAYQKDVKEQDDLRKLRHEYLHWSARREKIGMDPRPNRTRVIH